MRAAGPHLGGHDSALHAQRNGAIIAAARELFIESSSDVSVVDDAGNWEDASVEDLAPEDLQSALHELVVTTLNNHLDYWESWCANQQARIFRKAGADQLTLSPKK